VAAADFSLLATGLLGSDLRMQRWETVCVLLGSDVPFLLHPFQPSKSWISLDKHLHNQFPLLYEVRGQAYVDGIMVYKGDIVEDIECGKVQLEEYILQ
jgi:hypothetical protein